MTSNRRMAGRPVLEVGSGHAPHPRADVLVDFHRGDAEREGPLVRDRPLVIADGHALPFADGSFRLAVAHQVLEHAVDPWVFLSEMGRVAPMVDIETPSPLMETMFEVRPFHRWTYAVEDDGSGLVAWRISVVPKSAVHGSLFESLYRKNLFAYLLVRGRPDVFLTRWSGLPPTVREGTPEELETALSAGLAALERGTRLWQARSTVRAVTDATTDRVSVRWAAWRRRHLDGPGRSRSPLRGRG